MGRTGLLESRVSSWLCLGNPELPVYQEEDGVEILRLCYPSPNFLERVELFSDFIQHAVSGQRAVELVHCRDPWSAAPLLQRFQGKAKFVYEANGFPSIELPYAFPQISEKTLNKVAAIEQDCLNRSDHLITPSHSISQHPALSNSGLPLTVIPNGATPISLQPPRPPEREKPYLIYFGATQRWQGLQVLLKAFKLLRDLDIELVICSSVKPKKTRHLLKQCRLLGIDERVHWHWRLPRKQLLPLVAHAEYSVAPLLACSRNLHQGCSPLKILESMAAGCPVIASRLPSVEEIMVDHTHGRLVEADRPAHLARCIRVLLEFPEQREQMSYACRNHIAEHFTWEKSCQELNEVYASLLPQTSPPLSV